MDKIKTYSGEEFFSLCENCTEENIVIDGNVSFDEEKTVSTFPKKENITINGHLKIACTMIKELPNNLTVKGSLDMRKTFVSELPKNLTIGGFLDMGETLVELLPDSLSVGRGIYAYCSKLKSLPDNFTVNGVLDISSTSIKNCLATLKLKDCLIL